MKKINLQKGGRATHQTLRDLNEILVLNQVRERQPVSRIDIALQTGLEGSTVSKIVARLLGNGFVYEDGVGPASPQGGRKKRYLYLNPEKAYAIGIDLGPRRHTVAMADFSGRILRRITLENSPDSQQTLETIARSVKKLLQSGPPIDRVNGIGVSLVGLVDTNDGRMLAADSMGWGDDVPVGSILRNALNLDLPIFFENGSRLAALAETWLGAHTTRQPQHLVFLDISEGIGAGIMIEGKLYHGSLNGAGEFGHISIDHSGPQCSCGGRGCLEVMASNDATIAFYRLLCQKEGRQAEIEGETTIEELIARADDGNPRAIEALRQTANHLGRGLIPIIYSVNPEVIVLGGAITNAWEIIYPEIRRVLSSQVAHFYSSHVTITPSTLGENPSLAGAIALVLARAFSAPSLG
jgi:N-acetylglucosamine repressor